MQNGRSVGRPLMARVADGALGVVKGAGMIVEHARGNLGKSVEPVVLVCYGGFVVSVVAGTFGLLALQIALTSAAERMADALSE